MSGPTFITHEPPELMQEIRALWSEFDRLAKRIVRGSVAFAAPPSIGPNVTLPDSLTCKSYFAQLSHEGNTTTRVESIDISGSYFFGLCHVEQVAASVPWPSHHWCELIQRYGEQSWDTLGTANPHARQFHWARGDDGDIDPIAGSDSGRCAMPGPVDGQGQIRITNQMWDNAGRDVCYKILVWGWLADHRIYNQVNLCPLE